MGLESLLVSIQRIQKIPHNDMKQDDQILINEESVASCTMHNSKNLIYFQYIKCICATV